MEKISGILPSSPRLRAVDLKSSGAVRAGSPSFGRPVGTTSGARHEMAASAAEAHKDMMAARSMDPKTKIATQIADNFFNKKADAMAVEAPGIESVEDSLVSQALELEANLDAAAPVVDEMDRPEVGAYLDVEI